MNTHSVGSSSPSRAVDYVDPFIDTAKSSVCWTENVFVSRPFGMVRLSPNTDLKGTWGAGYSYRSKTIHNFSHLHAFQLAAVPVMPMTGAPGSPGAPGSLPDVSKFESAFRHETEIARPGYYAVDLDTHGVRAELTSTHRVGFHRYTFPDQAAAYLLFNIGKELGPVEMTDAYAAQTAENEISGYVENDITHRHPKRCYIYFVARFQQPIAALWGWRGDEQPRRVEQISGKDCGFLVECEHRSGPVLLKVGISYVSEEQSRLNLDTELPHWDFDALCQDSMETWNDWLGRIEVEGGTITQRKRFYTNLWHALWGGQTVSDVNGKYCVMTGAERVIRQIPLDGDGRAVTVGRSRGNQMHERRFHPPQAMANDGHLAALAAKACAEQLEPARR